MTDEQIAVEVLLFARAQELAGQRTVDVAVPKSTTVGQLHRQLVARFPSLESLAGLSRWAAGTEFVEEDFQIEGPMQIAMIPPVSGG